MVSRKFCEGFSVKALLVALVVLFVCGVGLPGEVVARVEMQNGHEGDPQDGMDVVRGGGGGSPPTEGISEISKRNEGLLSAVTQDNLASPFSVFFQPYFDGHQFVFVPVFETIKESWR